ncbi:hypothetical protein RugamoR64_21380 [Duganella rhizosphaerae]
MARDVDSVILEMDVRFQAQQIAAGHAGQELEADVSLHHQHAALLTLTRQRQYLDQLPILYVARAGLLSAEAHFALKRMAV